MSLSEGGLCETIQAALCWDLLIEELAKPFKASVISSRNGQKRKTCSKNDKIELSKKPININKMNRLNETLSQAWLNIQS
ncbi:MAG: hypothetical protein Q8Q40_16565 [Methylococcaceae bacterium]|nr:hypothetical protein [Methylococcaceae bacterium]MDP3905567.1 hypothetical protein [Methylococcaceae bacterium]